MSTGKASFSIRGVAKMRETLRRLDVAMAQAVERELRLEAEHIVTRAKQRTVPIDRGSLARSGRVVSVRQIAKNFVAVIAFGNESAPYALAVHEHPSDASPRSWRGLAVSEILSVRERTPWTDVGKGRGPKYLKREIDAATPGMAARLHKAAFSRVKR